MKWLSLKRSIVKCLLSIGNATIAELGVELQSSVPTITKAINELLADKFVVDLGKVGNGGGRRPALFSIASDCAFFLGVEVNRDSLSIGLQNLKNEFVSLELGCSFVLKNDLNSLDELCKLINAFVKDSLVDRSMIIGACVNLSGRINSREGFSHNYFFAENRPLTDIISDNIGLPVYIENDSRAMVFGEYRQGVVEGEQNILFLNYSWGVGVGIISNGRLYYGKSGYSGEFGHSPLFDNEVLCQCGKMGCLETEISGWALQEQFTKAIESGKKSLISIDGVPMAGRHQAIIAGVLEQEDSLCIELVARQGEKMGRYLSILVNMFNPDLLVVGGDFGRLGDFVLLPMQTALRKYSLGLVNQDMKLKKSLLGSKAGIIGACHIVKEKMLTNI